MRQNKSIDHIGVVKEVTPKYVEVEIINKSLCSACHAKSACSISDMKAKIIRVPNFLIGNYEVGEEVRVLMKKSMGYKAVWISYVIPLIILLILLLYLPSLNLDEVFSGLLALAGVVLYYIIIYLLRDKIAKKFTFTIEKQQ